MNRRGLIQLKTFNAFSGKGRNSPQKCRISTLTKQIALFMFVGNKANVMQKITPFLWFNNNAEEAINFYTSVFKDAKIGNVARYDKAGAQASGQPEGSIMTATFQLFGQDFIALNGGPHFKFTEAVSFVVNCENQEEVDYYWNQLTEGGQASMCGWLKDKFGLSWQIVPTILPKLLGQKDPEKAKKVMQAMLKMRKIDISILEKAAQG